MTGPFRPSTGGPANAPGQGGQPVHPTVGNLGMPGAPVQHETPRYAPPNPAPQGPPGWQMPPAPQRPDQTFQPAQNQQPPQGGGYDPNQNGYVPPSTFPNNPAPQPPQNQPPQNQPMRADIPDNLILDGANVPPELRGRSWGQVKQIYGALSTDFVMRQNGGGAPPQNQPPRQQERPAAPPVYEQGVRNGGQPEAGNFWENPGAFIERAIDSRLDRALAPVTQRTTAMAIQEARNVAAVGISDWASLEGEVMTILAGADPQALTDPRLWQSSADLARGRLMGRGEYRQSAQGHQNGQAPMQRGPGVSVPAPVSPVNNFFTEAPTPPQYGQENGYTGNSDIQARVAGLTNDQRMYAQKMQMSLEDYVAWQGGVQSTQPTRRY